MSCPFANVPFQKSNEVTESQKISYKIYDMEAEILKTTKHLEKLRKARSRLEEEDMMKRLGTVENIEKEFDKIYGEGYRPNRQLTCLKPLLTGIVYTMKDFDKRLKQERIHVHAAHPLLPLRVRVIVLPTRWTKYGRRIRLNLKLVMKNWLLKF